VLLKYHIGRFVLGSLCVGDLVRLGLSGVRVAGYKPPNPLTNIQNLLCRNGPIAEQIQYKTNPLSEYMLRI